MSKRFYSDLRTEPSMRQELLNTLNGSFPEIAKKTKIVLRKMRRGTLEVYPEGTISLPWTEVNAAEKRYRWRSDIGNDLLPCPCTHPVTKEADVDTYCPFCHGEGYIWDESFIDAYKVVIKGDVSNALIDKQKGPGQIASPVAIFYVDYLSPVTDDDKIVGLVLNIDGTPAKPYFRKALYRIGKAIDLRADDGRLEYWKLDCYAEYRKFLNGPGGV